METKLRDRILAPLKEQLSQGSDPRGIARTLATGVSLAIFPIFGATTSLCILAGIKFKLNQPILQTINYLLAPLQILLIPVFLIGGARLTGSIPISFNPKLIASEFVTDPTLFLQNYGGAGLHAILLWALIIPFLFKAVEEGSFLFLKRWRTTP